MAAPHLLVLPGAQPAGADEHGAGGAVGQRPLHGRLALLARDQVPLVEPGLDPRALEPDGQILDRRLVGAVVREEDVVFETSCRHRAGLHRVVVKTVTETLRSPHSEWHGPRSGSFYYIKVS